MALKKLGCPNCTIYPYEWRDFQVEQYSKTCLNCGHIFLEIPEHDGSQFYYSIDSARLGDKGWMKRTSPVR
jgi:ribosomal protein S27AE